MKRRQPRPELLLAIVGSLCCTTGGCDQAPGDGYVTYTETVANAAPIVDPAVVENAPEPRPATEPSSPELTADDFELNRTTEADVANTLAVVTPGEIESRDSAPVELQSEVPGEAVASLTPREIQLLVRDKEFHRVGPEGAVRVSYNDIDLLKVLNMDPVPDDAVSHFPDWLNGLDGQRIRIRGFMMPPDRATDLSGLLLARDNELCCFGNRTPMPYDIVPVILREGLTIDYIEGRPFDVVGVFHIEMITTRDRVEHVYIIDDATVID